MFERSPIAYFARSATIRSGCGIPLGFSSTALVTLKTAMLAPIPSASVSTAVIVKAGLLRNCRREYRNVCARYFISVRLLHQLLQLFFGNDLAVEEVNLALCMRGESRIVRHHADGRAIGDAVSGEVPSLLRRCANRGFQSVRQPAGSMAVRRVRGLLQRAAADRPRVGKDSAGCGVPCPRAPALPSRDPYARSYSSSADTSAATRRSRTP